MEITSDFHPFLQQQPHHSTSHHYTSITMSLQDIVNPEPQTFDAVLKENKSPLRSWRKKYKKMKLRFDKAMDQSNALFKDCHKLEAMAKRLQEENEYDTLLPFNLNAKLIKTANSSKSSLTSMNPDISRATISADLRRTSQRSPALLRYQLSSQTSHVHYHLC